MGLFTAAQAPRWHIPFWTIAGRYSESADTGLSKPLTLPCKKKTLNTLKIDKK